MLDPTVAVELVSAMPPGEPPGGTSMRPGFEIPLIFAPLGVAMVLWWTVAIAVLVVDFLRGDDDDRRRSRRSGQPHHRPPSAASGPPAPAPAPPTPEAEGEPGCGEPRGEVGR